MRKSIVCAVLASSLVGLPLCGCNQIVASPPSVVDSSEGEDESFDDVPQNTSELESDSSAESFAIGDIDSVEGTSAYVDQNGTCTPLYHISDYYRSVGSLFLERDPEMWVDRTEGSVYPLAESDGQLKQFTQISPSNGDRIITTINDSAGYYPVAEVGYYGSSSYSVDAESEVNGTVVGEIDPSTSFAERVSQILEKDNIRYISPTNYHDENWGSAYFSTAASSLSFGHYSGTKWTEETVEINVPCYVFAGYGNFNDLPVEKTKEGYFVIDYSTLAPGKYMLRSGNANYLIEIV